MLYDIKMYENLFVISSFLVFLKCNKWNCYWNLYQWDLNEMGFVILSNCLSYN